MSARHKKGNNPLLAKFQAELEAEYQRNLMRVREFDLIVLLLTANEELRVGPGRAGKLINAYLARQMEFSDAILEDCADDPEAVYSRYKLAARLKEILGPENWAQYHKLFPFLQEFWDD